MRGVEPLAIRLAPRLAIPPIFIVGLPRVGSTLASLLATRHIRCAFTSNMLMATPASPVATAMLMAWRRPFDGTDELTNRFGETSAPSAPNQGYRFWVQHVTSKTTVATLTDAEREKIRATVYALQGLAGGPFINKWQRNSLRIPVLDALFPGCVFVVINRNALAVAESILQARRAQPAGEEAWFSIQPPEMGDVAGLTVHEQIAAQIVSTQAVLDRDFAAIGASRVLQWDYADLCERPDEWLQSLAAAYHLATGVQLHLRSRVEHTLQSKTQSRVSAEDRRRLRIALEARNGLGSTNGHQAGKI